MTFTRLDLTKASAYCGLIMVILSVFLSNLHARLDRRDISVTPSVSLVPTETIHDVDGDDEGTHLTDLDFRNAENYTDDLNSLNDTYHLSMEKFEGDIDWPQEQHRSATKLRRRLWPEGKVHYIISNNYTQKDRTAIAKAMKRLQEQTCIRFVPKKNGEKAYLDIRPISGCFTTLGRSGRKQLVSLDRKCLYIATIQHELMHALGFFHEQSRYDRDHYIKILWKNMISGGAVQFKKATTQDMDLLGEKYDIQSIMHYPAHAFAAGSAPTIIPKDKSVKFERAKEANANDIRKINKLYKCSENGSGITNSHQGGKTTGLDSLSSTASATSMVSIASASSVASPTSTAPIASTATAASTASIASASTASMVSITSTTSPASLAATTS